MRVVGLSVSVIDVVTFIKKVMEEGMPIAALPLIFNWQANAQEAFPVLSLKVLSLKVSICILVKEYNLLLKEKKNEFPPFGEKSASVHWALDGLCEFWFLPNPW